MNRVIPGLLAVLIVASCDTPSTTDGRNETDEPDPVLEEVAGVHVLGLHAPAFGRLPLKQKLLAYYLYKAAVAGRDIAWDQAHGQALPLRRLLDGIGSVSSVLPEELATRLSTYQKLLWVHNGPYNERTKARIAAPFTRQELAEAAGMALAQGANLGVEPDKVGSLLAELDPLLFDPLYPQLATNKNPGPDGDMLRDSAVNYYQGVTMADLAGFTERYPQNSRLVRSCDKKRRCKLEEQVYRAGQKDLMGKRWLVEPGLYAAQLENVIANLEKAVAYAEPEQAKALKLLVEHFRTGDPALFDQASLAWLSQDSEVDLILGFIESYKDPRGLKGHYEGLVYVKDPEFTHVMKTLAELATHFEKNLPYAPEFRNEAVRIPVAQAIQAVVGVGHGGPMMPGGVNLPNAQWIREKHGSRSVLLTNVMETANRASAGKVADEFALPEDRKLLVTHSLEAARAKVALHEVIGHGSGKVSATLSGDPATHLLETYSTLEEARADLVALYCLTDPVLVEKGILSSPEAVEAGYKDYLVGGLTAQSKRGATGKLEDDHMRARQLIVSFLMERGAAMVVRLQGKTFYSLVDLAKAKQAVGELLGELMRIKATGDRAAALALFERLVNDSLPELRDEIAARAAKARIPRFLAFHVPELHLVINDAGDVTDVVPEMNSFQATMLQWDLLGP